MRAFRVAVLAVLLIAFPATARAQTTTASLKGTVKDLGGKPVVAATVRARSSVTGAVRTVTTDANGRYRIESLAPGEWIVVASLPDGTQSESRAVSLRLQQSANVDLTLGKGLAEKVTVRATPPPLDPQRVGAEVRVGDLVADSVPLAGRVVTDLPLLDASVRPAASTDFFGERGAVFVVNGQSGRSNSFLVDGLDNNDRTSGTSMNAFFSQLAVQEMVLNTSRNAAEFGRASGGVFNIVTRQGSNEESGELFLQGGQSSWNSPGRFVDGLPNTPGSPNTSEGYELGFRIGGPIQEDRAFYFAAYERQRENPIVPWVGVGRNGVAGGYTVAPAADDNLFLRTDFNLTPSQSLMVRLSSDARTTEDLNVGGLATPEAGFRLKEHDVQLAASLTSVLTPSLINEARTMVSSSAFDQFANSERPGVDRPSGSFGGNNLNMQLRDEGKFQVVDNLTWKSGNHTAKFGVDLSRIRTKIRTRFNPNGNFLYVTDAPINVGSCDGTPWVGITYWVSQAITNGTYPIVPCPPWSTGIPSDVGTFPVFYQYIDAQPRATLWDAQVAAFAQDTWQIHPKFLLDYGLRYDLSTFRLPSTARVDSPIPNGAAGPDRNNVAPRIGFTYTAGSDRPWVIRGGGGIFYDKLALAFPAVASIMSGTAIHLIPMQGYTYAYNEDSIEDPVLGPLLKQAAAENQLAPANLIMRFSTGSRLDTPHTSQWSLGAERNLGRGGSVRLEVTRALGFNLPLMRDLNPVTAYEVPYPTDPEHAIVTNPDPRYVNAYAPVHQRDMTNGSIVAIVTQGRSWYWGADLAWRWQGDAGWYSASYTLSRAEDMAPDPLTGGIYLPPDSDHLTGERGRSDSDRRHRFVFSGDHALPWMGLHASGVIQLASAAPFNVITGQDNNLDGITTDRPVGVDRNTGNDTPLGPINALREQENVLRRLRGQTELPLVRSLHTSSFVQVDLRVSKPFAAHEGRSKGELFVQIFNLLDRFNPGPIDGRAISPTFGKPIGLGGPPRTMQLGFRLGY